MIPLNVAWQAESLLVQWFSLSFVLLSLALVFYHFTRLKRLQFNRVLARIISAVAALAAVVLSSVALYGFTFRTAAIEDIVPHEARRRIALMSICGLLVLVLLSIAGHILFARFSPDAAMDQHSPPS
jgi:hypothetical protein